MKPLISIVMPVFNTEAFLGESLRGILLQDYHRWELLVILDGGPEVANALMWQSNYSDPRIRWLISQQNRGLTRSRNLGIRCAQGTWIAFCDSDDAWRSDKLSTQWRECQEGNYNVIGTGFAFVRNCLPSATGEPGEEVLRRAILPRNLSYSTLLATNALPMSSAMVHTEVLGKHYFPESVGRELIHEDYGYWLKLFKNPEVKPKLVQRPLVLIRIRPLSRSSNKFKAMRAHASILLEHLGPNLWNRMRVCGYLGMYLYWALRKRSGSWLPSHEFDWNQ